MQLLYINELEKIKKLDDFHIKQRRGLQVTHHWDEELTPDDVKEVMKRVARDSLPPIGKRQSLRQ